MSIKVTIVYDNTSLNQELKTDWGFACVVDLDSGERILFDTGADGSILLSNMRKLKIDPAAIDMVFISHNHFDHAGGLSQFIQVNPAAHIYVPQSLRGLKRGELVHSIGRESCPVTDNVFSTGELEGIEQSMIIKTDRYGKVYALIGGLHGFNEFELISDVALVCPTHCTAYIEEINKLIGDKFIRGGVGREIVI
jgi:7,8-dihydropterin-6-yl-methyl-4-(beta-D-ribofuranosyl)aminobenzene 5'-phosphate synthase